MSLANIPCKKIEIYGLLTSYPYQIASKCAKILHKYHPDKYCAPQCKGMLECDWQLYIAKQRRKYGGELLWSLQRPVTVYMDKVLIGSDQHFLDAVSKLFNLICPSDYAAYRETILLDYTRYMQRSQRWYVYLDIKIDDKPIGLLVFQLYSDLLPKTCRNFCCLCSGERGTTRDGISLCYVNTEIHRICKGGWIQGGDIVNVKGGGGMSVYGPTFTDESYCIGHDRRGVLSMANDGKNTNASQFLVTLDAAPWMDRRYVAFGQLVEGEDVLTAVENVATFYEKPTRRIHVWDSGIMFEPVPEADLRAKRLSSLQAEQLQAEERRQSFISERDAEPIEELGDSWVKELDVLDDRDLPSEMCLQRYLDGLYSLEIPDRTYGLYAIVDELMDSVLTSLPDSPSGYRRDYSHHPRYLEAKGEAETLVDEILEQATAAVLLIMREREESFSRYTNPVQRDSEDFPFEEGAMFADFVDSSETISSKLSTWTAGEEMEEEERPANANYGFGFWERPESIEAVYVDLMESSESARTMFEMAERDESIEGEYFG